MKKCSIICTVRNDNYGNFQWERTVIFLKSLDLIPNKNDYELLLVEWNPIPTEESFYEKYKNYLPKNLDIKIVTVPYEIHNTIYNPNELPVFEYYAKNVGARYSSTKFLIFTNPDNYFFERTWKDIINNISDDSFLRLCRSDVKWSGDGIDFNNTQTELPNLLMRNHYHFYGVPGTEKLEASQFDEIDESFVADILHCGASGDFFAVSKENYFKIKGYREYYTYSTYDGIILKDCKDYGLKQVILPKYSIHIDHSRPHLHRTSHTVENLTPYNDDNWGLNNNPNIIVNNYLISR